MCVEFRLLMERLVTRYKSADLLNAQHTERVVEADFDEKEQEAIYNNILVAKVSLPTPVSDGLTSPTKVRPFSVKLRLDDLGPHYLLALCH